MNSSRVTRTLALAAACAMAVCLTACSSGDSGSEGEEGAAAMRASDEQVSTAMVVMQDGASVLFVDQQTQTPYYPTLPEGAVLNADGQPMANGDLAVGRAERRRPAYGERRPCGGQHRGSDRQRHHAGELSGPVPGHLQGAGDRGGQPRRCRPIRRPGGIGGHGRCFGPQRGALRLAGLQNRPCRRDVAARGISQRFRR